MCLGWLYHHLWDLAHAGTREAQCASWAQYDTALEQSPVCWATIPGCGGAATILACCWVLELLRPPDFPYVDFQEMKAL